MDKIFISTDLKRCDLIKDHESFAVYLYLMMEASRTVEHKVTNHSFELIQDLMQISDDGLKRCIDCLEDRGLVRICSDGLEVIESEFIRFDSMTD